MQDNQIYVACLAAYNSGHLHGEWITPANDKDELQAQIKKKSENEKLANSFGLELSDFSDDGADLDELKEIMEGN